jgi:hypothetical protein
MREHLTELLPLVLVGLVLLVFQLTRDSGSVLKFLPLQNQPSAVSSPAPAAPSPKVTPGARLAVASPTPAAATCTASRPSFVGGLAALKASLGASMGEPLECERAVDDEGDTQQNTTMGLAYYRSKPNVASFTTGWDHWALREGVLVHWTGDSIDTPSDAAPISHQGTL